MPHTPPRASSRLSPARCREVAAADVALTAPPAPHRAPRPEQRRGPSAAPFPKHPQGGAQPPAPPEAAPRQDAAWCPGDLARARPDTDIPPLIPQDKIFQARPVTWMPPSALKAEPGLDGGCSGPARTPGRGSRVGANPRGRAAQRGTEPGGSAALTKPAWGGQRQGIAAPSSWRRFQRSRFDPGLQRG